MCRRPWAGLVGLVAVLVAVPCVVRASKRSEAVIDFVRHEGDASGRSSRVQELIRLAREHRAAIRQHLGVGDKADGEMWLDRVVGFPNEQSRQVLEHKLRDAVERGKLTVGMMGISTTAGHDNHYNQSYSKVFERHFGTVLRGGGVELEVRNHAVGGFGVTPATHLCVNTMVGTDLDILGWDYQMMAPRGDCLVEHFARAALNMPSKPALLFWQGGVWLPKNGKFSEANVKPIRSNLKQSCGNKWLVDAYAGIGAHYGDLAAVLHYLRYLGQVPELADGTDPLFGDPTKGQSPAPDFSEPALPTAPRGKGQGQQRRRLARHHPGPTLHRMWGLVWAHAYLGVLVRALTHAASDEELKRSDKVAVQGCNAKFCDKVVPTCATDMFPRVPEAPTLSQLAEPGHAWQVRDNDNRGEANRKFSYLDRKMVLSGSAADGPIVLNFETQHDGMPLVVCEVPCPWGRCKGGRVMLLGNANFELDAKAVGEQDMVLATKNPGPFKNLVNKDTCMVLAKSLTKGKHRLSIKPTVGSGQFVVISHLIFF